MMWAEALLSSTLLFFALLLAFQAPLPTNPIIDFYQYQSLEDDAAIFVEKNLTTTKCTQYFQKDSNYCHACLWTENPEQNIFTNPKTNYTPPSCTPHHSAPQNLLTVSRGTFREGKLQFFVISKFKKQN
ncbi:MAG: hypothetical protein ABIH83_03890 [Candidatus Micrarchaeota archaeon]